MVSPDKLILRIRHQFNERIVEEYMMPIDRAVQNAFDEALKKAIKERFKPQKIKKEHDSEFSVYEMDLVLCSRDELEGYVQDRIAEFANSIIHMNNEIKNKS